jgi:hypothetical protein
MSQTAHLHSYLGIPCSLLCYPRPHPLCPLQATPIADFGERSFQDVG